jgi:hypothetical protein
MILLLTPRVNTLAVCIVNGIAAPKISADIRKQQMGSASVNPNKLMHSDEIITATLPKVSASTCKKTPYMFSS